MKAITLSKKAGYFKGLAVAYRNMGIIFSIQGNYEKANEYSSVSLSLFEKTGDKKNILACSVTIGNILMLLGENEKALNYLSKALIYYKGISSSGNDPHLEKEIALCHFSIGSAFYKQGDFDTATENILQSLRVYEELLAKCNNSNEILELRSGIISCYISLGLIHWQQGNYKTALEYFSKALDISNEYGNNKSIMTCYNNMGCVYREMNELDRAKEYFHRSLNICKEIKDLRGMSLCYGNLGLTHTIIGNTAGNDKGSTENYNIAVSYFIKSIEISDSLGDKSVLAQNYLCIGNLYSKLKEHRKAIDYCNKGLTIAKETGELNILKVGYENISQVYANAGDYNNAFESHLLYSMISDSLFKESSVHRIAEMQTKYETEKKEQAITGLKKDKQLNELMISNQNNYLNLLWGGIASLIIIIALILLQYFSKKRLNSLLEKQKKELIETNNKLTLSEYNLLESIAAKDKFFSIISHDLRGPLSSIERTASVIRKEKEKMPLEEILKLNEEQEKAISRVNILLENLLIWAKSQTGNMVCVIQKTNLTELISNNIDMAMDSAKSKNINIVRDIKEDIFVNVDSNMIDTVIRNLLSNSIKYSFPDSVVAVKSDIKENQVVVSIEDSGTGIKSEDIKKLFRIDIHYSRPGTANEKGSGLGLIICKEFVEKNNGKIWVESNKGKGSIFSFTLPLFLKNDLI